MRNVYLLMLCFGLISASAQNRLIGKVLQTDGSPIDYFVVKLMTDTTAVAHGSFVGGLFSVDVPQGVNAVEVSAWNFQPLRKDITSFADTILYVLTPQDNQIEEVSVMANKRNLTIEAGTYTLAVAGTDMEAYTKVTDILRSMPLVTIDDNGLSVFGKDAPAVYINNRPANDGELASFDPKRIKDIKLITSPSAKYDADVDAVIVITTKDSEYGVEVSLGNTVAQGRGFYYANNSTVNLNFGQTNLYLEYGLTIDNDKSYESNDVSSTTETKEYSSHKTSVEKSRKPHNHGYILILEHSFENSNLSFQFDGSNRRTKFDADETQNYKTSTFQTTASTHKYNNYQTDKYSFNAAYEFMVGDNQYFYVSGDYMTYRAGAESNLTEGQQTNVNDIDNDYKVAIGQFDYETVMSNGIGLMAGVKWSYVKNESDSEFGSENDVLADAFTYKYDFSEKLFGAYFNLQRKFDAFSAMAGLRVEHTDFEGNNDNQNVIDTTYFTFVPNVSLNYVVSENNNLSLSYQTNISRPTFSNLSPNIRYDNQFFYRRGNPSLLPTITNSVSLMWSYASRFWANAVYRHKRNDTIFEYYDSPVIDDVIEVLLSNHKHVHFLIFSAGYNLMLGRFSSSNSVGVTKPFAKVKLVNDEYKIERPAYYFKTDNRFSINKNVSLNANFVYNDYGDTRLEHNDPKYNLTIGATGFWLDRRLSIALTGYDILDTDKNVDHRKFGSYNVDHKFNPDNTYVNLSVRYIFRSGKTQKVQMNDTKVDTERRL